MVHLDSRLSAAQQKHKWIKYNCRLTTNGEHCWVNAEKIEIEQLEKQQPQVTLFKNLSSQNTTFGVQLDITPQHPTSPPILFIDQVVLHRPIHAESLRTQANSYKTNIIGESKQGFCISLPLLFGTRNIVIESSIKKKCLT